MSDNKKEKNPFRELRDTWREIRKRPLTDKQISEINSIIENEVEETDSPVPLEKVAQPIEKGGKVDGSISSF